jgi:hypothetical protein
MPSQMRPDDLDDSTPVFKKITYLVFGAKESLLKLLKPVDT